jgi:hypothetical protein
MNKFGGRGMDSSISGQRQVAGFCQHSKEFSVYVKFGIFLTIRANTSFPRGSPTHEGS